jgi:hypothetical protein
MEDFFTKFGLQVSSGAVEIGQTYPIFGIITGVLDDTPGSVLVEINYSIKAKMNLSEASKIEVLKERAFEPGIFVSTVTSKSDDEATVDCQTVVFGRRPSYSA